MRRYALIRCLAALFFFVVGCDAWAERNLSDIPDEGSLDENVRAELRKAKRPADMKQETWENALGRYKIKMSRNAKVLFFGKVVDQDMQPLKGVQVSGFVRAYDSAYIGNIAAVATDQKDIEWTVLTDKKGRFVVRGLRGLSLHIRKLEKEGYLAPTYEEYFRISEKQFRKNVHKAKEDQPVVLKMWAQGKAGPDLKLIQKAIKVNGKADGTEYRVNLETGACVVNEDAPFDISIKIEAARPSADSKGNYDWSFSLSAHGGGFIATDAQHPFEAPEDGYASPFIAESLSADEEWSRRRQQKLYVRTRDGALHAVLDITVYAYRNGKALVRINSVVNPSGSRNLAALR